MKQSSLIRIKGQR